MNPQSRPKEQAPPVRAPFKRRGHIVLALLAVLIVVGIVPLSTMSWKFIQMNRETLTTAQQEIQLMLASSIAHELDLHVEGLRSQLVRVAQTLGAAVRRRGVIPREEIREVLAEVAGDRMSYIRYTYFQGQTVKSVSSGDHPDYLEPLFTASLQQAAEHQADLAGDESTTRAIISDPFLLRSNPKQAMLVVAAPVTVRGSFRGVLTALVDLQGVWREVTDPKRTGHTLFALDEEGNVFAGSEDGRVRPGQEVRNSELVKRFLSADGRARETMPFKQAQFGEERRYIGAFEETRQGWGIFVQAPDKEVYWTVRNLKRRTLNWSLALLGIAGLLAIFFSRSLSNPVNKLAAASRALANGDFSARVEVRSRNEIGELAHGFNRMASEIESQVRRLKQAFQENNELFLGTIRALAQAIDAKDPYTQGHSVRVNRYSVILARQLGLEDSEIRDIHVASLMHDVGKIGIDDSILRKSSALTDAEYETIKTHPVLGANIMKPIRQMTNMIPGLRHHHERCDGSGYPDGLERDQTPLMARIIAVADTFDAITTNRPYQSRMTFEQAQARINEIKGTWLDEKVVEAFNRACHAGLIRLEDAGATPKIPAATPEEVVGAGVGQAEG